MRTSGRFVGNGLDRSVQLDGKYDISGNRAPFGAILCAARSQRCGAVKTRALHYYPQKGFWEIQKILRRSAG